jgi:hypothetical protein
LIGDASTSISASPHRRRQRELNALDHILRNGTASSVLRALHSSQTPSAAFGD